MDTKILIHDKFEDEEKIVNKNSSYREERKEIKQYVLITEPAVTPGHCQIWPQPKKKKK